MHLQNIWIGMIVKNYPELCRLLGVKILTGNSKMAQLKWFEDYFSYRKEGHKFIIKDVYHDREIKPMPKRGGDMSDNTHIEYIEKLILDLLIQDKSEGEIFLSKSRLYEVLSMVNENYGFSSGRIPKLAKFTNVEEINAEEWISSTSGMLERNLNKALNRLEDRALISWSRKLTVCKITLVLPNIDYKIIENNEEDDSDGSGEIIEAHVPTTREYREATPDEIRSILAVEEDVMKNMGCDGKQNIIATGKWKDFERKVKNRLLKESRIAYYWKSYHIIFNPKSVLKGSERLNKKILESEDREEYQGKLNKAIQENVHKNSERRSLRAKSELEEIDKDSFGENASNQRLERRADENYISDSDRLGEALINKDSANIKTKIYNIKID